MLLFNVSFSEIMEQNVSEDDPNISFKKIKNKELISADQIKKTKTLHFKIEAVLKHLLV